MPVRTVTTRSVTLVGALALVLALGCGGDDGGSTGSGSATEGGSSTSSTGYGGDGDACPVVTCVQAEDCCERSNLPGAVSPVPAWECPSSEYPHNWECVTGLCVRFESGSPPTFGCTDDAHCAHEATGYVCLPFDGIGRCVRPCSDDADCPDNIEAVHPADRTYCTAEADTTAGTFCHPTEPP
jgi:hypothetical protein